MGVASSNCHSIFWRGTTIFGKGVVHPSGGHSSLQYRYLTLYPKHSLRNKTSSQSLRCYSACLIRNSPNWNFFGLVLLRIGESYVDRISRPQVSSPALLLYIWMHSHRLKTKSTVPCFIEADETDASFNDDNAGIITSNEESIELMVRQMYYLLSLLHNSLLSVESPPSVWHHLSIRPLSIKPSFPVWTNGFHTFTENKLHNASAVQLKWQASNFHIFV